MHDPDKNERSIWSSKYDEKPNKMRERMNSGPPVPKVKRTRMQAVLTALPVLMLLVGMFYHWNQEAKQTQNAPIETEHQFLDGYFERITPKGDKAEGKHYLWLRVTERTRPIRITYEQKQQLLSENYAPGDALKLKVAPTVESSTVLWLMDVTSSASTN